MSLDCRELRDLILLDAADQLAGPEQWELHEHLGTGCPQCAGYRAEAEATLAQLSLSLNPVTPPASVKKRFMASIQEVPVAKKRRPVPIPFLRFAGAGWPSAIAAAVAVISTVAVFQTFPSISGKLPGNARSTMTEMSIRMYNDEVLVQHLQRQASVVSDVLENFRYAQLSSSSQPSAVGRVLIDTHTNTLHFTAWGMKANTAGHVYQLWLITDARKSSIGSVFAVNNQGTATMQATIPADSVPEAGAGFAVTEEAAGGAAVYSGKPVMKGVIDCVSDQGCTAPAPSFGADLK